MCEGRRSATARPRSSSPGPADAAYRLADHRGRWVVLAFYPGDFTPVCTRQFCSYRDAADRLDELDAEVLGISPQSVASHERFAAEHGLTVPLLADPDTRQRAPTESSAPAASSVARSSSSTRRGSSATAMSRCSACSYKDVERLAGALAQRARGRRGVNEVEELAVEARGRRTPARRELDGDGAPVVLLHGLTASRRYVVHGSRTLARGGLSHVRL